VQLVSRKFGYPLVLKFHTLSSLKIGAVAGKRTLYKIDWISLLLLIATPNFCHSERPVLSGIARMCSKARPFFVVRKLGFDEVFSG
jgi:hypothetical protein